MNATDILVMPVASYFVNMYFLGCLLYAIRPAKVNWRNSASETKKHRAELGPVRFYKLVFTKEY